MKTYRVAIFRLEHEYGEYEAENEEEAQRMFEEQGGRFAYESELGNIHPDDLNRLIITEIEE